jgi:ABC-type multidrug transport system ATPase subunit
VYKLFDEVLVLREGRLVYQGPREDSIPFFTGLGYACPANKVRPTELECQYHTAYVLMSICE